MQKTIKERLRCKLTPEELVAVADRMNDALGQIEQIEADAKRVAGEYKAKVQGQQSVLVEVRNAYTSGIAMRDVECEVQMDTPEKGKKSIIRMDTRELVRTENMSHDEMHPELPMGNAQDPAPAPGEPLENNVGAAVRKAQEQADSEALQQAKE